ncbi:MAG TPA: DNA methyltransferase [Chloroflexia bacterium]|jgi:DNA modification methylase
MSGSLQQPEEFTPETTTVWSFPQRGAWATHKPDYRGNFAPQVARNILLNYSQEGEFVLDPMVGSGTTLIEAKLLNRNALGTDINQSAVDLAQSRLNLDVKNNAEVAVQLGDVRNLSQFQDNSVDLIITHPPYWNIVKYSDGQNPEDLSSLASLPSFFDQLALGIRELYRVLKPNRYCAILIGDTRKGQHCVPLSHFLLDMCIWNGFALKEEIIKVQHNTRYGPRWSKSASRYNFYLIMHEHLFIFRKPALHEDLSRIKYSSVQGWALRVTRASEY